MRDKICHVKLSIITFKNSYGCMFQIFKAISGIQFKIKILIN